MVPWGIWALGLIVICVVVLLLLKRGRSQGNSDVQVIGRLMEAGADLTRVHQVEFLFYFPSPGCAEEAAGHLRAGGYKVSVEGTTTGTRCAVTALRAMVPLLSEMQALRTRFDELATRAGGLYETWRAEPVK